MITNKVEYLLRILMGLCPAEPDDAGALRYRPSKEIAERQEIPPKYMPQLVSILVKQGWVASIRALHTHLRRERWRRR